MALPTKRDPTRIARASVTNELVDYLATFVVGENGNTGPRNMPRRTPVLVKIGDPIQVSDETLAGKYHGSLFKIEDIESNTNDDLTDDSFGGISIDGSDDDAPIFDCEVWDSNALYQVATGFVVGTNADDLPIIAVNRGGGDSGTWFKIIWWSVLADNRWRYYGVPAVYNRDGEWLAPAEDDWEGSAAENPANVHLYNTIEANNAATGTLGSGENAGDIPGGNYLLPIGIGAIVKAYPVMDCDGAIDYLFTAPNNVGGNCMSLTTSS